MNIKDKEKNSFVMYLDYEQQFNLLNNEQAGQLIKSIIEYEKTELVPEFSDGMVQMAFSFIKCQLDRDREKWKNEIMKRSSAGKKGMEKRWGTKTQKIDENVSNNSDVITNDSKNNVVRNDITRNNKNN